MKRLDGPTLREASARPSVPERSLPGLNLDECSFGSCQLGLGDFVHAVSHEPRTRQLIRSATYAGALSSTLGIWQMTTPSYRTGLVLFGVGILCFAAHSAPEQIATRWFAKTPRAARSLRYTLNPEGLISVSEVSHQVYPWHALLGYHQAPEAFLVWVSSQLFLIIPKRAFQAADLPKVIERFERELGAPPRLPRFWSWLLLAVASACLGLWLWNRLAPR